MARVFIGVGHGGSDSGAVGNGLRESIVNLNMALAMKAELERHGVTVGISRVIDEADRLAEEIAEANAFRPDYAVEVHNNSGGGDGFEAYYQTNSYTAASRRLAVSIETEVKAIGQNSRGVKTRLGSSGLDYYAWLRKVKAPAVLCEGAFLDSSDSAIINTFEKQQRFGIAYAKGTLAVLGIAWRPPYDPNVPSDWARAAWEQATALKITDGLRPHDDATREQVIVMLKRAGAF